MQDYLQMLQRWHVAFAQGFLVVSMAAIATPERAPAAGRRLALDALGAVCAFDPLQEPDRVAKVLILQFSSPDAWPFGLRSLLLGAPPIQTPTVWATTPSTLTLYCQNLSAGMRRLEDEAGTVEIDWVSISQDFWAQWIFPETGVAVERSEGKAAVTGFDLLHAVRHGGVPVMPRLRGNPSIGQWCRVLSLAGVEDENVSEAAIEAGLNALGFPEEIREFLPDRSSSPRPRLRQACNDPILVISVKSARSDAWSWRPEAGVRVLMHMPADIIEADHTPTQAWASRSASLRILSRVMSREGASVVHCVEVGVEGRVWLFDPFEKSVVFGVGPAPQRDARHVGTPTGVGDLLQRLRQFEDLFVPPPSSFFSRVVSFAARAKFFLVPRLIWWLNRRHV
jgi:hypothetical protein